MPLFRSQFKHYLHLVRFYQPVGTLLLLFPCWWGGLAATKEGINLSLLALFGVGAFAMRGAGCIVNDMWDRKIDAQVERTKHRPLASGAVSMREATLLLLILLSVGASVLVSLPPVVWKIALYSLPLVVLYPLMKRFFPLPQLFLGLTFNWGILVGWVAVKGTIDLAPLILYAAAVFWTLGYDTIYACQDAADDKKLGVHSAALTFGRHTRVAVNTCYGIFALLLGITGFALDASLPFYIVLGLLIGGWARVLDTWKEADATSSLKTFKKNSWLGLVVAVAFLLENLT
jgi:4-hydroxybenzoate polyprenyltransferase